MIKFTSRKSRKLCRFRWGSDWNICNVHGDVLRQNVSIVTLVFSVFGSAKDTFLFETLDSFASNN